jgi:hypothetical protein
MDSVTLSYNKNSKKKKKIMIKRTMSVNRHCIYMGDTNMIQKETTNNVKYKDHFTTEV